MGGTEPLEVDGDAMFLVHSDGESNPEVLRIYRAGACSALFAARAILA
jgi:hypothetical protein